MKNLIFAFAFMLVGTFAFAHANLNKRVLEKIISESNSRALTQKNLSNQFKLGNVTKFLINGNMAVSTCHIEIDVINSSTGEVMGTVYMNVEISGGSLETQQSACRWIGSIFEAMLNL